jgi:hypothetical protein
MYDVFDFFLFLETSVCVLLLISAMELALALGKLVNEKLHNLHSVSCSYCIACIFFFQDRVMLREKGARLTTKLNTTKHAGRPARA